MRTLFFAAILIACTQAFAQTIDLQTFLGQDINVVAVTSPGGVLDVGGYDPNDVYVTKKVALGPTEVLAIGKSSWTPRLSLVTIPFKVRPAIDTLPQAVQTGLTNAGISTNIFNYKLTRYFNSGKQSTHQFGVGILIAPTAEELRPDNTNKFVNETSKQLFISTGLCLTYTYNDLTFAMIPAGFDFATTDDGRNYVYNQQYWWGFGIGITTKLFGLF